jgi:hypothetical protein
MATVIAFILLVLAVGGAGTVSFVLPPLLSLCAVLVLLRLPRFRLDTLSVMLLLSLLFLALTLVPLPTGAYSGVRGRVFSRAATALETSREVSPQVVSDTMDAAVVNHAYDTAPGWHPMTLNLAGSGRFAVTFAMCLALFFMVRTADARVRRRVLSAVVLIAVCVVVCGLIGRYLIPQGKTLLWLIPVRHGKPMGPFVNRNHFALLCALAAPLALSFAVQPKLVMGGDSADGGSADVRFPVLRTIFFLACFLVLVAGAFHSLSRSGSLAVLSGVFVTALLWVRSRPLAAAVAVFLGVVAITAFVVLSHGGIGERRETLRNPFETASAQHRLSMWGSGLQIWLDFPLAGVGAEGFRAVYPAYKSNASRKSALQAENEYVQVLAEGGAVGAILSLAACVFFLRAFFRCHWTVARAELFTWRRRGGRGTRPAERTLDRGYESPSVNKSPGLFYAVCGVLVCAAVHCMFEFGFRMPLNAAVLAVVLGAAVPVLILAAPVGTPLAGGKAFRWAVLPLVLVALLLVLGVWRDVDSLDKDWRVRNSPLAEVERAVWWAPTHWLPWYALSQRHLERSLDIYTETGVASPQAVEFALYCADIAVGCNPNDYRLWRALAEVRRRAGYPEASAEAARRAIELRPYLANEMREYLEFGEQSSPWKEF